jgi:hypothetical protein
MQLSAKRERSRYPAIVMDPGAVSEGPPGPPDDGETAEAVRAILDDGQSLPQARVLALVEALDRAVVRDRRHDRVHGIAAQALARAVAAAGRPLLEQEPIPQIAATLAAAEAYARAPSDETHLVYFERATSSYPYGSGEGHYGVETQSCEPGTGCRSGAGTLFFAASAVGFDVVIRALAAELAPWLRPSSSSGRADAGPPSD